MDDLSASPTGSDVRRAAARFGRDALASAVVVTALAVVMWVLEAADYVLPADLDSYGILARDADGLTGILLAPLLHAGFGHLAANTLPLLVLGFLAAFGGLRRFLAATAIIVLAGGIGVWLTAPSHSVTIGASGLVFGYFGYVLARGVLDRRVMDIVAAVVVLVFYGSLIWGVLPSDPRISWQGHLFGLIGGVLAAWMLKRSADSRRPVTPPGAGRL